MTRIFNRWQAVSLAVLAFFVIRILYGLVLGMLFTEATLYTAPLYLILWFAALFFAGYLTQFLLKSNDGRAAWWTGVLIGAIGVLEAAQRVFAEARLPIGGLNAIIVVGIALALLLLLSAFVCSVGGRSYGVWGRGSVKEAES